MPKKSYDDASGLFWVEFRLPAEAAADEAWLAGEFNDWSLDACPLERQDDGSLAVVIQLEPARSYRFRYYLGDGGWENDWAADAYVENEHGGSDSVVTLPVAARVVASDNGPPPVAVADGGDDDDDERDGGAPEAPVAKKATPKKAAAKKKAATKKAGVKKAAKKAPPA